MTIAIRVDTATTELKAVEGIHLVDTEIKVSHEYRLEHTITNNTNVICL